MGFYFNEPDTPLLASANSWVFCPYLHKRFRGVFIGDDMLCDICKKNEAKFSVELIDVSSVYKYKNTNRCGECVETAKRSHENLEIVEIVYSK